MIIVVDYGLGNINSICNMLSHLNIRTRISNCLEEIIEADKLILPGVGSFDAGMMSLRKSGLDISLSEAVLVRKKPVLGICLGMQLMTKRSEEGKEKGLGWFNASTEKFKFTESVGLKIPHMGWNRVISKAQSPLFEGLIDENRFYFVHSYHVVCENEANILAECCYGESFVCAIRQENIWGVQFHPEKSHRFGMRLLKNFAELK